MNLPSPEFISPQDEELRCPRCGKRIRADMLACPSCALELVPHKTRISCRHCGSRVLADMTKCPRCGKDPRPQQVSRKMPRWVLIVAALALVLCVGWVVFRAATTNVVARVLGSNSTPTASPQLVQVIYVVATPVSPTPIATPTQTPTPIVTPSPTRKGTRAATLVPTAPPGVSSGYYPAVPLIAPLNTTVYSGANANIVLEWQSVAPNSLRENEWYEIKVTYTARDGTSGERKSYSKETKWVVAQNLYGEIAASARAIKWTVTVVRVDAIDPLVTTNRVPISIGGTIRTFIWN